MRKFLKSKILVALLALSLFLGSAIPAAASEIVIIDKELAAADAAIHRQDGLIKGALLQADIAKETEAAEGEKAGKAPEKPAVRDYEGSNEPNRIAVTFKNDPATSRAFNWYTSEKLESFVLVSENADMSEAQSFPAMVQKKSSHYVERDENGYFVFQLRDKETGDVIRYFTDEGHKGEEWDHYSEIEDKETQTAGIDVQVVEEYAYKAEAVGLKPAATYYYQVGSEEGGLSEIGTFVTAAGESAPFSFLHYTDTQNAFWNQHLVDEVAFAVDTIEKMLATDPEAAFVLHTGDIVEIAEVEDEWVDLFDNSRASFMKTTLAPVSGNHDEYGLSREERFTQKWNDHFNVPAAGPVDGGSYYSFDYNNVHFIILNTNDYKNEENKALGDDQLEWLRWDVKQARANGAEWIILNYHKPIFSKSYHSLQDTDVQNVRDEFMAVIDELDIDLALQGHDHVLSRTKSLKYVTPEESVFSGAVAEEAEQKDGQDYYSNPTGTIFLLPNTGGTKTYDDIYSKGLDHIIKVRPKLNWLTEELVDEYNNLFAFGGQPDNSPRFAESHSNFRNSTVQNFARYTIDGNTLSVELYEISGNLDEAREPKLVDSFVIEK
jgi:hypothetical protein